jgi:Tfp pilus assembly protein PilF
VRLAESYEAEHNYGRALEAYRQALDYDPRSAEILNNVERLQALVAEAEQ